MITAAILAEHILALTRGAATPRDLVAWAEKAVITFTEAAQRPPDADAVWDVLLYLSAADSPGFPLTPEVTQELLARLGHSA